MKRSREQTKAELMAEAEAVIEELLEWERQAGAPDLSEMEDEVLKLRQRLGKRLLEALIEDQEARQPVQAARCSQCGMEMRSKGQKGADIETRLGGVKVERSYYYCAHCKSGVFPPP